MNEVVSYDFEKRAAEFFQKAGLPNKKNEKWKYTNLERYWPKFDLDKQTSFPYALKDVSEETYHIVFINGVFDDELSNLSLTKLSSENQAAFSSLKQKLGALLAEESIFQLVESQSQNQYLLELESIEEKPIRIHHVYSGQRAKHSSAHLHVLAKTNSEASFMETHEQLNDAENFINNATSFYLQDNSKIVFIKAQSLNDNSSFVQNTRALVERDARFESFTIDAGARLSRNNIWIKLDAEGASCAAHGLCALSKEQQSDTNSYIHHAKPHTESSQLYKSVLDDKSHGIFTGLIRVEKNAQLVSSQQLNKNLLLSKGAHAHSRPQLEIYADDVKCAHGSTTGQLSEEEIFYFEARGIPPAKAQKLLAQAFAYDVLLKIKNKILRKKAQELLEQNVGALKMERQS